MPYVHSSLIPYAYVAQTFSLRSTDAQTKSLCYKVRLETTSTVVIRVKDKALRTSYFLYRAHVKVLKYIITLNNVKVKFNFIKVFGLWN